MHPAGDPAAPDQDARLAFLRSPSTYGEGCARVEVIETHMSWLFLTEQHAWKLKKPFRHDLIDYGTPAARYRNCQRELRLNRRLAPDVYLAVLALRLDAGGQLRLGGRRGRPLDWLVKMRRLPASMALDRRLQCAAHTPHDDARHIVGRLAPFHAAATPARFSPPAYRRHLEHTIVTTVAELERPEFDLDPGGFGPQAQALRRFLDVHAGLFDARVRAGRVVDGHGDLRPEHIYMTDPPTIVDCIEFSRSLRLRDPADELAFLAMECERLGHPAMEALLFTAWEQAARDAVPTLLVSFHKACNALVRAKIAIWHLDDPRTGLRQHWLARTEEYLDWARRYAGMLG